MNQAEKIRKLVTELFLNGNNLQDEIVVNNSKIKGIRYSVLKSELLKDKYNFTEGGVTGALYTLTDKMDFVFKVKTKNGVYFYYSSEELAPQKYSKSDVIITESKEYVELVSKAEELYDGVRSVLVNASNGFYREAHDIDVQYLREILKINSQLKDILKEYRIEKSFEKIKDNNIVDDGLPF